MFDTKKIVDTIKTQINKFVETNKVETFYAFAIDASLLCFNSVEQFQQTLLDYAKEYPKSYVSEKDIKKVRENTGDWAYQGFYSLTVEDGFDEDLYEIHYEDFCLAENKSAFSSEYSQAMTVVIDELNKSMAFEKLKRTSDFYVTWVDHDY